MISVAFENMMTLELVREALAEACDRCRDHKAYWRLNSLLVTAENDLSEAAERYAREHGVDMRSALDAVREACVRREQLSILIESLEDGLVAEIDESCADVTAED